MALDNANFISKAPQNVVNKERLKVSELEAALEKLNDQRKKINSM